MTRRILSPVIVALGVTTLLTASLARTPARQIDKSVPRIDSGDIGGTVTSPRTYPRATSRKSSPMIAAAT